MSYAGLPREVPDTVRTENVLRMVHDAKEAGEIRCETPARWFAKSRMEHHYHHHYYRNQHGMQQSEEQEDSTTQGGYS